MYPIKKLPKKLAVLFMLLLVSATLSTAFFAASEEKPTSTVSSSPSISGSSVPLEASGSTLGSEPEAPALESTSLSESSLPAEELKPDSEVLGIAPMFNTVPGDPTAVVVESFAELKGFLESGTNSYTTFYLGADIVATSGIGIHPTKTSVIIDGAAPGSGPGVYRTYTDQGTEPAQTIYVPNVATTNVTMQNINLVGNNHYGSVYVPDDYANTTVTFSNITYNGLQLVHALSSKVRIYDSTITISNTSFAYSEEVGEMNAVEFGGNVTITSNAVGNGNAVLAMNRANPSIVINEGADVTVVSNTGSHYFIYANVTEFVLGKNARLSVDTVGGFSGGTAVLANATIQTGARLYITQHALSDNYFGALRIGQKLEVQQDAILDIRAYGAQCSAIRVAQMYPSATITFNNPKQVLLYSEPNIPIYYATNTTLNVTATSINRWQQNSVVDPAFWDKASNKADFTWSKAGLTNPVTITGSYGNANLLTGFSTNMTAGDETTGGTLNSANYSTVSSKMLVFSDKSIALGSVSGIVFNDINHSAVAGGSNTPKMGVAVVAYESGTNNVLASSSSGVDGSYILTNLSRYQLVDVVFTNPVSNDSLRFSVPASGGNHLSATQSAVAPGVLTPTVVNAGLMEPYIVTFNGNGGNPSSQMIACFPGEAIPAPAVTLTGYQPSWYTATSGGTQMGFPYGATNSVTLYAQWVAKNFSVTFDANGGSGTMPSQTLDFGQPSTVTANTYTRSGYAFAGWSTTPEGTVRYVDKQAITLTDETDLKLYAVWTANAYSISFDAVGGAGVMNSYQATIYQSTSLPTNAYSKAGYKLAGWGTSSGGPAVYADGGAFTLTIPEEKILYAVWEIDTSQTFTVKFDAGSGIDAPAAQILNVESFVTNPTGISNPGYKIEGWYQTQLGTDTPWDFNQSAMPAQGFTLYAKWVVDTSQTYEVSFRTQGGGTSPSSQWLPLKTRVAEPTTPSRTGYTFEGWYTEPACTTKWDFTDTINSPQPIVLYALWTPQKHTLLFNGNGAASGTMSAMEVVFSESSELPGNNFLNTGYRFIGWSSSATGNVEWIDMADFTLVKDSDITLFALWEIDPAQTFVLTFDTNKPDNSSASLTAPPTQNLSVSSFVVEPLGFPYSIDGYYLAGWSTQADNTTTDFWNFSSGRMSTSPVTLYAIWKTDLAQSFSATFVFNNGAANQTIDGLAMGETIPGITTPSKEGYLFDGWFRTSDFVGSVWNVDNSQMPPQNITLFARWKVDLDTKYTVKFVSNATGAMVADEKLPAESDVTEPSSLLKTGYRFAGWFLSPDFNGAPWNFSTDTMPARGFTLYAKWVVDPGVKFSVRFDAGGFVPDPAIQQLAAESFIIQPAGLVRAGYRIEGWYQDISSGTAWDFAVDTLASEEITLHAKWVLDSNQSFPVYFATDGGLPAPSTLNLPAQSTISVPTGTDIVRPGYIFDGWYTDSGFASGTVWDSQSTTLPQAMTLYAKWIPDNIEVVLQSNYPDGGKVSIIIPFGISTSLPTNSFSRVGYLLQGWAVEANGPVLYTTSYTLTTPSEVTLYAVWGVDSSQTYEVKFDLGNGPGAEVPPLVNLPAVIAGSLLTNPGSITYGGYKVDEWYSNQSFLGNPWNYNTDTTPPSELTLYAKWVVDKDQTFPLVFVENGASTFIPTQYLNVNNDIAEPAPLTRTGYIFKGWYIDESFGGIPYVFSGATMEAQPLSLYARWQAERYTITFGAGGGTGTSVGKEVSYGETVTLPLNTFLRSGYRFSGWSTSLNGPAVYADGDSIKLSEVNNIPLFATWTVDTSQRFTVTFVTNIENLKLPPQQLSAEEKVVFPNINLPGYNLVGWYTNNDFFGDPWDFASSVIQGNDITLYAKWNIDVASNNSSSGNSTSDTPSGSEPTSSNYSSGNSSGSRDSSYPSNSSSLITSANTKVPVSTTQQLAPSSSARASATSASNSETSRQQVVSSQMATSVTRGTPAIATTPKDQLSSHGDSSTAGNTDIAKTAMGNFQIALYGHGNRPEWSAFNLVLGIVSLGLWAATIVQHKKVKDKNILSGNRVVIMFALTTLISIIVIAIILLTSTIGHIVVVFNIWSIPLVTLVGGNVVVFILMRQAMIAGHSKRVFYKFSKR